MHAYKTDKCHSSLKRLIHSQSDKHIGTHEEQMQGVWVAISSDKVTVMVSGKLYTYRSPLSKQTWATHTPSAATPEPSLAA